MENASEALKIAGGILLALMTISVFIFMFSNISTMGEARENQRQAKYIANWNAEWEAYNKKIMYGTEVLSVINKASSVDEEYKVNIEVDISADEEVLYLKKEEQVYEISLRKTNIFKCVGVTYGGEGGRIDSMTFEFVR